MPRALSLLPLVRQLGEQLPAHATAQAAAGREGVCRT
jgi:hypothetical protein